MNWPSFDFFLGYLVGIFMIPIMNGLHAIYKRIRFK